MTHMLTRDEKKGRNCPECGMSADRPKCAFELGGGCPRLYRENYDDLAETDGDEQREIRRKAARYDTLLAAVRAAGPPFLDRDGCCVHCLICERHPMYRGEHFADCPGVALAALVAEREGA